MATTFERIMNNFGNKVEAPVRSHLKNVYGCLAGTTLCAAAGAYVHLFTDILSGYSIMTPLASLGIFFYLLSTPEDPKNTNLRLGLLGAFGFVTGLGLGPLLDVVISVNPSIIPTAFLATCLVFGCFTMSAMYARRFQYIILGGTLMSFVSTFLILSLVNIFLRSQFLFTVHLYGGLLLFCGFILYDTQLIMEKCRVGEKDYVRHSLDLFMDFVTVFRHILIILTQKEANRDQRRKRQ